MSAKLKVVFAGTPEFAVPSLRALLNDPRCEVVAVFTQPDRPAGRGQKLAPPPVKILAEEHEIPVWQPESLKIPPNPSFGWLRTGSLAKGGAIDFLIVVAYGLLLPPEVLAIPKIAPVNLHASLLPKYRGASPIQQAILNGDAETGVSFMRMEAGLDTGSVFAQEIVKLSGSETAAELTQKLAELGGERLPNILVQIASGKLKPESQDNAKASVCKKVRKDDGRIHWKFDPAEKIERKLRAYTPWPGIFTHFAGQRLKILKLKTRPNKSADQLFGTVFRAGEKICVATWQEAVELKRVQLAGKKELSIEEFVRGEPGFIGARLW